MQPITTIGFDIAKSVFQVHGVDAVGEVVRRHRTPDLGAVSFSNQPRSIPAGPGSKQVSPPPTLPWRCILGDGRGDDAEQRIAALDARGKDGDPENGPRHGSEPALLSAKGPGSLRSP
jgi:hypothetical protein